MDILTLELFDVTVSRALLDVKNAIERHPGLPMRILVDSDEMLRLNLARFLERQGRPASLRPMGSHWQLDVPGDAYFSPAPTSAPQDIIPQILQPQPFPALQSPPSNQVAQAPHVGPKPVLLLRSAFVPGDRALGRQLLLGVLEHLDAATPWIVLAHDALELLEDPRALEILCSLKTKGVSVRLSQGSLDYLGHSEVLFEPMEDSEWQSILGKDGLTVL